MRRVRGRVYGYLRDINIDRHFFEEWSPENFVRWHEANWGVVYERVKKRIPSYDLKAACKLSDATHIAVRLQDWASSRTGSISIRDRDPSAVGALVEPLASIEIGPDFEQPTRNWFLRFLSKDEEELLYCYHTRRGVHFACHRLKLMGTIRSEAWEELVADLIPKLVSKHLGKDGYTWNDIYWHVIEKE